MQAAKSVEQVSFAQHCIDLKLGATRLCLLLGNEQSA